jgi:hypothetical protein
VVAGYLPHRPQPRLCDAFGCRAPVAPPTSPPDISLDFEFPPDREKAGCLVAAQRSGDEAVPSLELAIRAPEHFEKQPDGRKRRLLHCERNGALWLHRNRRADFGQPFDRLAKTALSNSASDSKQNPFDASKRENRFGSPSWTRIELSRFRTRVGQTYEVAIISKDCPTCCGIGPVRGPNPGNSRTRAE